MLEKFEYSISAVRNILESDAYTNWKEKGNFHWITTSSQEAKSNSLFVALEGNTDGHQYIEDALRKGAIRFIARKNNSFLLELSAQDREKGIYVEDTLLALGKLAAFHRDRFAPLVIGITGSSGKTTTKDILSNCLSPLGKDCVVTEKNYNNEIGVPFTLFRISENTRVVVCEMGMNHAGEIHRLSQMARPRLSFITNIGSAHIEFLGSRKNIAKAKLEILDGMDSGPLFYPAAGDFRSFVLSSSAKARIPCMLFDPKNSGSGLKLVSTESWGFRLRYKEEILNWNVPGMAILGNLFGCVEVLERIGVPKEWISDGIRKFQSTQGRLQLQKGVYSVIDDSYNANRESMIAGLDAAEQISEGKGFYAILGDMKEVGKFSDSFHKEIGKIAALHHNVKGIFTVGQDSEKIMRAFQKYSDNQKPAKHFHGVEDESLWHTIQEAIPTGCIIFVKASRSIGLDKIVSRLNDLRP